jgi:hypothetical protein
VIFVMSPDSLRSAECAEELALARTRVTRGFTAGERAKYLTQ